MSGCRRSARRCRPSNRSARRRRSSSNGSTARSPPPRSRASSGSRSPTPSPVDVRIDGLGAFEAPVTGPAPVAYLAVESPGLEALHARLVEAFGAVEGLEGEAYVPHVTVARGGDAAALEPLDGVEIDPVEWTVTELWCWDARPGERTGRIGLSS
ncbi:MAG: 2'-5' RNA ligase family protein [Halobacteriales archaeon]|nr:2'-5' RNA ligase family protein [Halobacteriales archaeon]